MEKSIQAGQENIRRRIEELHTLLKKAGKNDVGGGRESPDDFVGSYECKSTHPPSPLHHHPDPHPTNSGPMETDPEDENDSDFFNFFTGKTGEPKRVEERRLAKDFF